MAESHIPETHKEVDAFTGLYLRIWEPWPFLNIHL